jgi:hypothetical protein
LTIEPDIEAMFTIAPPPFAQQRAAFGLAGLEHAPEVDVDHGLPHGGVHLRGGRAVGEAGAVDGQPQRAELALHLGDRGSERLGVGDVGFEGQPAAADRAKRRADVIAVEAADAGAGLGQSDGNGPADAYYGDVGASRPGLTSPQTAPTPMPRRSRSFTAR